MLAHLGRGYHTFEGISETSGPRFGSLDVVHFLHENCCRPGRVCMHGSHYICPQLARYALQRYPYRLSINHGLIANISPVDSVCALSTERPGKEV